MTQVDPAAAPRPGRRRDHTRDTDILRAARDVLAETGYDAMTIDMVAARARAGKATVYRRWASKAELVADAVADMGRSPYDRGRLPDTGTLRGDLIALIKPSAIEDGERRLQVVAGLAAVLSREPELAEAVNAAVVEPRAAIHRTVMRRAAERGEISADRDIDTLAVVMPSMVAYRVLILRRPVDRAFLVSLIDGVILPALGLSPGGDTKAR